LKVETGQLADSVVGVLRAHFSTSVVFKFEFRVPSSEVKKYSDLLPCDGPCLGRLDGKLGVHFEFLVLGLIKVKCSEGLSDDLTQ
jgi:hypothetical protein